MTTALNQPAKITSYFHSTKGIPGSGWTESLHLAATTIEEAETAVQAIIPARMGLAAPDVSFDGVRISGKNQKKQDVFITFSAIPGMITSLGTYVPTVDGPIPESVPSGTSLMIRASDANGYHTTLWVGSPVAGVVDINAYNPDASYIAGMVAYLSALHINCLVNEQAPGTPSPITSFDDILVRQRRVRKAGNPIAAKRK